MAVSSKKCSRCMGTGHWAPSGQWPTSFWGQFNSTSHPFNPLHNVFCCHFLREDLHGTSEICDGPENRTNIATALQILQCTLWRVLRCLNILVLLVWDWDSSYLKSALVWDWDNCHVEWDWDSCYVEWDWDSCQHDLTNISLPPFLSLHALHFVTKHCTGDVLFNL